MAQQKEVALFNKDNQGQLDRLGAELSMHIKCTVVLDSRVAKPMFTCYCGITFPLFAVQGAVQYNKWDSIMLRHKKGNSFDGGVGND